MPAAHAPRHAVVVGAGMVGLATAWHLQERGVEVTVVDRSGVGAGSSWGNAGWLPPALTTPLPEPAVLRYGVRALVSPSSPVYVPLRPDPRLFRFLTRFARHSTSRRWRESMRVFASMNAQMHDAYDELTSSDVDAVTRAADPFLVGVGDRVGAEAFAEELRQIRAAGVPVEFDQVDGATAREADPSLGDGVHTAFRLRGQRFLDPGRFVTALAEAVVARGGKLLDSARVDRVEDRGSAGVTVETSHGDLASDAAVLATGTWLNRLASPFGVRQVVQAGRGYSFHVPVESMPAGPVYFPDVRVACTPLGDRLRVAGMMEFRVPEAELDPRRIRAIIEATRPRFRGVAWEERTEEWVGSRPCTGDGLPLIGPTRSPRVHVAGGHGMWGVAWGPLTGRLLAEAIVTGRPAPELASFDPLR